MKEESLLCGPSIQYCGVKILNKKINIHCTCIKHNFIWCKINLVYKQKKQNQSKLPMETEFSEGKIQKI